MVRIIISILTICIASHASSQQTFIKLDALLDYATQKSITRLARTMTLFFLLYSHIQIHDQSYQTRCRIKQNRIGI